jgi:hypothetical protein
MTGRAPDRPVDSLSSSLFAFKNIMFRIFQLWTILLSAMVNAQSDCRLWLAPSSVSTEDAPKLGLFAGVNYSAGDVVGQPELAIPLIDFVDEWNRRNELDEMIMSFLEGFMWTTDYAGAKWESRHGTIMFIPGHGVLANYHSGDYNVDWSQSSVLLRTPPAVPEAGKAHPSRGAITPYFNLTITATQPIQAGMELFANFGEVWDGNGTDVYQDKLVRSDYKEADKLVDALLDLMEQYRDEMTPQVADDVLEFITRTILTTAAGQRAKAIKSLIPAHPGKLQAVKDVGGTFNYRNPDLVKSPKWLLKHGTCVDNIRSGPSTIPEAGRGAFATRHIKEGTVIAPMPMIQIPEIDLLNIYPFDHEAEEPDFDQPPMGQQLIMNYCFGHPESNMVLMPVGPMVTLINHSREQPNAKIKWASRGDKPWGNSDWWLDMHPSELVEDSSKYIGIVMEVMATRDIRHGEEIFIDYGDEWQEAWDEYMEAFQEVHSKDPSWPLKADDLNVEYKSKPFKTMREITSDPYPKGIKVRKIWIVAYLLNS